MAAFLTPEMRLDPFPLYAMMRSGSPLFHFEEQNIWLAFRYDDVKTILSDHARFSSQYGGMMGDPMAPMAQAMTGSMITADPPRHTQLRNLVSRAFTPRTIAALEPRIQKLAHELLDRVIAAGSMDLVADLASPLPVMVIAEMLGIPTADRIQFKHWSDLVVSASDNVLGGDSEQNTAIMAAMKEMADYFRQTMAQRRLGPKDDLISDLLAAEVEGSHLSEEEIVAFCWLLLVAGNETTTNLIGNAVRTFLEHPDQLARLQADLALLPGAIEEVLRYRSPVQMMFRIAAGDVELGGQTIRKGQGVVAVIGSANRDEERFPEPDRFDITRDPNPHIAFGQGIHFCLGAPLARLESRVALTAVLERLHDLHLADGAELAPAPGLIVHGVAGLPLRFKAGEPVA